jgi:hypothetical protein
VADHKIEIITIVVIAVAAFLLMFEIWWMWWRLPKVMVSRLALKIRDPKARADVEDNFRKTIFQAITGAGAVIAAGFTYFQFLQQQKAAHDLLISNQVSKGFEQLAGKEIAMRLGGIYALEGVMNTSEQYHKPVLEALCAFVRENTIGKTVPETQPTTDIQAALTVIGRRTEGPGEIDLANVRIPGADLNGANLRGANLYYASLIIADLRGTDLTKADLTGANLTGAKLIQAQLDEACGDANTMLPEGLTIGPHNKAVPDERPAEGSINANYAEQRQSDVGAADATNLPH